MLIRILASIMLLWAFPTITVAFVMLQQSQWVRDLQHQQHEGFRRCYSIRPHHTSIRGDDRENDERPILSHSSRSEETRERFIQKGLWTAASAMGASMTPPDRAWALQPDSESRGTTTTIAAATTITKKTQLGKTSTALDVLLELQQCHQLAPYTAQGVAIVTGGNAGIGAETVKMLAQAGMTVILCTRRLESGQELVASLDDNKLSDHILLQKLDLADMASIQQASKDLVQRVSKLSNGNNLQKGPGIDLLVNNAGVSDRKTREETVQGLELQFGTNHVGHHMFTRLLLPQMNVGGRIVTVSSSAHKFGIRSKEWGSGNYPSPYSQSKLCNILFAKGLQDRLNKEGRQDLLSVSLHPGAIATKIWRNTPAYWQIGETFFLDKTLEQGTATSIYCSLVEQVAGGGYYLDCHLESPSSVAQDLDGILRDNLWSTTEDIIAAKGYSLPAKLI